MFGTDNLGRDVLSRFLWGGRSILGLADARDGARRRRSASPSGCSPPTPAAALDDVLMRAMDVILAFPSIVLTLVAVATVGPSLWLIVIASA